MGRALVAILTAAMTVTLAAPGAARADDYYVTIFTAESVPYRPTNTHAFASLVRVPCGPDGKPGAPEVDAICWGPASLKVRGITLRAEEGANMTVTETIEWCRRECLRVSVWGPYRVKCELYEKLKEQSALLSSGKIKYKSTDTFVPRCLAMNCYHALTHPVAPLRRHSGVFNPGDAAGTLVLQCYNPWLIDPCTTHDHILSVIGADKYELVRRSFDYRPGRIDAIRSAVGR
jgi:hypothetical protein